MRYVRSYADADGESHFEEVAVDLRPVEFAPPAPPLDVSVFWPAAQYGFVHAASGWSGDWHPTPRRQLRFVITGESEDEVSDGSVRRFGPGSVVLMEDTTSKGHLSRPVGELYVCMVQLADGTG
jgi:hypothetical protein